MKANEFLKTEYTVGVPIEGDTADETQARQAGYERSKAMLVERRAAYIQQQKRSLWARLRTWWGGGR